MNIQHYQEKRKIAFFSNYLSLYFVWVPGESFSFSRKQSFSNSTLQATALDTNFYLEFFGLTLGSLTPFFELNTYFTHFKIGKIPDCSGFYECTQEFLTRGLYIWFGKCFFCISVHPHVFLPASSYSCTKTDKLPLFGFKVFQ
jgi:hypothetical protein